MSQQDLTQDTEIEQDVVMEQDENATAEIYGLLACLLRTSPNQDILNWLAELEVEESSPRNHQCLVWFKASGTSCQGP